MSNFKQRYGSWALVTGATSGIGAALAEQLAAAGQNLVLVARTQANLDAVSKRLMAAHGIQVRVVAADLTQPGQTQAVIDAVNDLEIAVLVPCAAIESHGYFVEDTLEHQQQLMQLDVVSPMQLVHHFGGAMAARGRGAILLVASVSGWMAQPYLAAYGAAKAYIVSLGASLHQEMKDKGVDVAVLSPGPTETPMAAGTGIDFASMGMAIMKPDVVARVGLDALGKRTHAIAGIRNRVMVFMMTRLMPRALADAMLRMMMGKALGLGPRPALSQG